MIVDPGLRRAVRAVLERLPPGDAAALEELVRSVTWADLPRGTWARTGRPTLRDGVVTVEIEVARRRLGGAARRYVLAHELAHALLRHAQQWQLAEGYAWSGVLSVAELDLLQAITEDAAAWQAAVVWGFRADLEAYLRERPAAGRPGWYKTTEESQ